MNSSVNLHAFSTGARPIWESDVFKELVLSNSLSATPSREKPHAMTLDDLIHSLGIMTGQLAALFAGGAATQMKQVVQRTHMSFAKMMEMIGPGGATLKDVTTPTKEGKNPWFEYLNTFVLAIKALMPSMHLITPMGSKGGNMIFVLHCDSMEHFTLAVCTTGEDSPMLIRNIPVGRPAAPPSPAPPGGPHPPPQSTQALTLHPRPRPCPTRSHAASSPPTHRYCVGGARARQLHLVGAAPRHFLL